VPLPPILEVYVLWHPGDELGERAAKWLMAHFNSPAYAGLAGGAVEVYIRSAGWLTLTGPPRPIPFMEPLPAGLPSAEITAVVLVLGRALARAVRDDEKWRDYVMDVVATDTKTGSAVGVYLLPDPRVNLSHSTLSTITSQQQALPKLAASSAAILGRELAQAITQRLRRGTRFSENERLKVFVSHTKWNRLDGNAELVDTVRAVLQKTHLCAFFDEQDIQVGADWKQVLETESSRCVLLMMRTDLYSGREWTQYEVLQAKLHDLPVVALFAVRDQEDRGSFLMDNVPVVPCPPADDTTPAIEKALNRLVDEALKVTLWRAQSVYLERHGFDWLPAHAPEPVTLAPWLKRHREQYGEHRHVLVMHPDPPLGPREREVVVGLCRLAGFQNDVDVLTPRTFASRGGRTSQ
jgi:hypothetical protein